MTTIEHITFDELETIFRSTRLPNDTRLTVTFEDSSDVLKRIKKKKALEAMKKLKGSGTGNLVSVLLEERAKDKLL